MQSPPEAVRNTKDTPINRSAMLRGGTFLILLGALLLGVGFWALTETHHEYKTLMAAQALVLLQSTGVSAFYAGFPLFIGLILFGIYGIGVGLKGKRNPVINRRMGKLMTVLAIVGLVGLVGGRPIGNGYWSGQFQEAGYSQCAGSFSLTQKWFQVVWVRDPGYCGDREVRRMLGSHEYGLLEINRYVKNR